MTKGIKGFQKGHKVFKGCEKGYFVKGQQMPREMVERSALSRKGVPRSEETKLKISKSNKGQIPWNKNLTFEGKEKERLYKTRSGDNCYLWKGGGSYGLEFTEDLKESVRKRDRRVCRVCGKTELENNERLSIHHINYDKTDNSLNNLLSVCRKCHMKLHGRERTLLARSLIVN